VGKMECFKLGGNECQTQINDFEEIAKEISEP
jgi:hypothetical protein